MVNQILEVIYAFIGAFGLFLVFKVAHAGIALLQAHTKNAHILIIEKFADQVVSLAEKTFETGADKQALATNLLNRRLAENGLSANVTPKQVEGYIEAGVDRLKQAGLELHAPKEAA